MSIKSEKIILNFYHYFIVQGQDIYVHNKQLQILSQFKVSYNALIAIWPKTYYIQQVVFKICENSIQPILVLFNDFGLVIIYILMQTQSSNHQLNQAQSKLNQASTVQTTMLQSQVQVLNQEIQMQQCQPQVQNVKTILCSGKIEAISFCSNSRCTKKPIFICGSRKCRCQLEHKGCLKGSIDFALQIIHSKLHETKDFSDQIEKLIDNLIDELSLMKEHLLKQVRQRMKYTKLYEVQRKFLKISENPLKINDLNNQQASQMWKIINTDYQCKFDVFKESSETLKQFEKTSKQSVNKIKEDVDKIISKQVLNPMLKICECEQRFTNLISQKSSICNNEDLSAKLIRIIPKKIKKIELLFKASEHNFSLPKYYELCGSAVNTITIALTNKDKIFGGYTPFCFYSGSDQWIPDTKKETFLFSLSENQRFILSDSYVNNSIYRRANKEQYIQFGGDFYIYHNANTNGANYVGYQSYYPNTKYKNDKDSYLKLNGNQTHQCTLKEWEVFRVQFE